MYKYTGEIWRVTYSNPSEISPTPQTVVAKIKIKILAKHSNALINGKIYKVHENIFV